ncbi:Putative short-chain dehydrogenase/reductase SDR, NAD(P)-binding domain superfamily [Septoria linicola]|uniref:Short-chain dehydrogenase/reductase SDR, NAD(P)-binding domain superfamily n=1 Tax=Septoria linicola TaxID=215465 RepID=A0A9Q9B0D0_9PEZI|nr:putative short-chain dehydrogenase/reductase SDR, NAD(P)-binding domain superfamily [Septoria linicola]USW55303.1 Putative short-chain dehydrogenase/reductase SDR, NAD(P)-binding domain superfamily [Septoria linicola]
MSAPFPSPTKVWHTTSYPSISPERQELSVAGKTVLVTGGGSGIGAETAYAFAIAGAARIGLLGRRLDPLFGTKARIERDLPDVEVYISSTDATDQQAVDDAFNRFVGDTGKIDILISSAAVAGPPEGVGEVDTDKFLSTIDQNIKGSLHIAQAFVRHAISDAVAINISSGAAHLNVGPGFAAYSVSKMAIYRLWDSLGYTSPGLRIFHVQPGLVDTDMNREAGGSKAMGFEDHVSLPAHFNVWLASPEANFLKGRFSYANWDVDELKARAEAIAGGLDFEIQMVGWPFGSSDESVPKWNT